MANGFLISIDLGQSKSSVAITDVAPGTAGLEINVDHTKYTTPKQVYDALVMAAELVLEKDYPAA